MMRLWSADMTGTRHIYIAFQSNNNKFVPIDLTIRFNFSLFLHLVFFYKAHPRNPLKVILQNSFKFSFDIKFALLVSNVRFSFRFKNNNSKIYALIVLNESLVCLGIRRNRLRLSRHDRSRSGSHTIFMMLSTLF